ncbi:unnamed protein product, partial [Brenthis ino]
MSTLKSEDLYLNRAKLVMKYLGVWVPAANETITLKSYRLFMIFLQYLFLLFQIIYIFQVWGDLEAVSQASYLLFTQACLCFKITVLQINVDLLKDLLNRMNSEIFLPQSREQERILKRQAKRIKQLLLAFMISSQTTCLLWALKPLFDDAGSRNFPFDMWMPVRPEFSPQYELGFAFQLLTICTSAYMYFGADSIALSMVIFACAQLNIIKDKILNISFVHVQGRSDIEKTIIVSENNKKLIDCIKQHQAIVSYFLSQVDWRSMQFFSILTYLSVMISQLFVCCWCGHELTATSEELPTVLYKCPWYEQDLQFMRTLRVAAMRMGRPTVLRAGHYISLSRPTFVAASVCYKVAVFILHKKNLKSLLEYMMVDIFVPQSAVHSEILITRARKVKRLCAVFLVSAFMTCSLWASMPWFDEAETRSFPFKIWMPVSTHTFTQYILGYLYQIVSVYISALLFFAVDSTTLSMIIFGCAQLEIVIDKIKKVKNVPMSAKLNKTAKEQLVKDSNELFIQCIHQHQEVIRFVELLENTYHANIFFQLSGTVGIICIIGLRITITEPSSVQFYSMLNYMVTMLSQLLLYCWCGTELTTKCIGNWYTYLLSTQLLHESEDLRQWIYQCPWYEQDFKFRRSLVIAMECMKKPIIFKAGHYIPLSRPTFVSILRSSYSYFAVLNQANNK